MNLEQNKSASLLIHAIATALRSIALLKRVLRDAIDLRYAAV